MKRKKAIFNNSAAKARLIRDEDEAVKDVYDLTTPLWSKYYREVRKNIRFPRYYKRSLNW